MQKKKKVGTKQGLKDFLNMIRGGDNVVVITITMDLFLCHMNTTSLQWYDEEENGLINMEFENDTGLTVNVNEAEIFVKEDTEIVTYTIKEPKSRFYVDISCFL